MADATGYDLPRPLQQGSTPQIGTDAGEVEPAGNQQQQPLQSVHDATSGSGLHTALHDEESPPLPDFAASIAPVDPLEPDPLSSLEGPPVPLVLLLQAASPTVDDAPMATMTWKSLSIFMKQPYPQMGELGTQPGRVQGGTRDRPPWHTLGRRRSAVILRDKRARSLFSSSVHPRPLKPGDGG